MATKICVIHVGTHKTGTTSFQAHLAQNSEHFLSQGLYYPITGRNYPVTRLFYGHHNLAWELTGDRRYRRRAGSISTLADELRRVHAESVVLSSELFQCLYRNRDALLRVRTTLRGVGYLSRIVMSVRRPSEYVQSLYWELTLRGLRESPESFVDRVLSDGTFVFRELDFCFDYNRLACAFSEVFGESNVRVLRYNREDSVTPLLDACGALLGLSLSPGTDWKRLNTRGDQTRNSLGIMKRLKRLPQARRAFRQRQAFGVELNNRQREQLDVEWGESLEKAIRRYGE